VKIDLDAQLYRWRQLIVDAGVAGVRKRLLARLGAIVLSRPVLFRAAGRVMRVALRAMPRAVLTRLGGEWARERDLPDAPAESFHNWLAKNRAGDNR
jgi:L-lactate dehydrogenase complex protein LldF